MSLNPDQFFGVGVDALFKGAPKTVAPFPPAGRNKNLKDYDEEAVQTAIAAGETSSVDPRTLHSTQPWVTLEGVRHYASGKEGVFANQDQYGNSNPVVYHRENQGRRTSMLLSGHHRATAALVAGKNLEGVIEATGGFGPPRKQSS
jgi:hypothetical protein